MTYNKIPTEEEFAHAKALMRERDRGLSEVCEQIKNRFEKDNVYKVSIFFSSDNNAFYPFIFYRWNKQIEEAEKSGLSSQIKGAVLEELERVGRGKKDTLNVVFEFDSHENVEENYEGDYFNRLR